MQPQLQHACRAVYWKDGLGDLPTDASARGTIQACECQKRGPHCRGRRPAPSSAGIGLALSSACCMIAGALFILWRLLRDVDIDKVVAAITSTPPQAVLSACAFVAAGYVTLTFYDYFALRTIGRREVPYRTAAFASYTS